MADGDQVINMLPRARPLDFVAQTYAGFTTALMVPVTLTVVAVVWGVQNLTPIYAGRNTQPVFVVADESSSSAPAEKLGDSLLNALVVVGVVGAVTFLMVLLYKCNCIKVIVVWFVVSAALIFFFLCWVWCDLVFTKYQVPYDYVTMGFFLWNFGIVGILSLFYYGHPKLMQSYLVVLSVIMGWLLTRLPEWTTWAILLAVAVYDILAVLCPGGPLALLVKEAQNRNEQIPGFVYDSGGTEVLQAPRQQRPRPPEDDRDYGTETVNERAHPGAEHRPLPHRETAAVEERPDAEAPSDPQPASSPAEEPMVPPQAPEQMDVESSSDDEEPDPFQAAAYARPFKLGLGDFIFYSLLVGRASEFSYVSWITALLFVGVGLIGTLCSLLFLRGKVPALPALPISIFSGVLSYFAFRYTVVPMCYYVSTAGIML